MILSLFIKILRALFSVDEKDMPDLGNIKRVLVVRQHNQFGDLLASVSLFRAIKEKLPESRLTVITSPENYYAVSKNKFIDEQFVFDKRKLFNPEYIYKFINLLRSGYDLVIVPVTVAISDTSCLIGRIARAGYRIGPASLNGKINEFSFLFNKKVEMNWAGNSERHVSDYGLDIVRPIGISTDNYKSEISFDETDIKAAQEFLRELKTGEEYKIIGLHIGAGKPPNRWGVENFAALTELINTNYKANFYVTGSGSDEKELEGLKSLSKIGYKVLMNRTIPELAAVISRSDLFIANDTGVMHVAGATETPQISLFGPTNPDNWAPLGENKISMKKTDLIDDITVEEVFKNVQKLLSK